MSFRLESPIHAPKIWVLGEFYPRCVVVRLAALVVGVGLRSLRPLMTADWRLWLTAGAWSCGNRALLHRGRPVAPLTCSLLSQTGCWRVRSFRYSFTSKLITIQPLLDSATEDLFSKMKSSNHCLHPLLSPDRTLNHVLRTIGHSFQYPHVFFCHQLLFKFLTWVHTF